MTNKQLTQAEIAAVKDAQLAAYLYTAAVFAGFAVYWVLQIQSVREMLALAYG